MSKIKNGALDQYGAGPFDQQQLGTGGVEGVNTKCEDVGSVSAFIEDKSLRGT